MTTSFLTRPTAMRWDRLPLTSQQARRLADRATALAPAFPRAGQLGWAAAYLAGLASTPGRKTLRAMAAHLPPDPARPSADPGQALHNFLTQSPWDDRRLLAAYRSVLADHTAGGSWLVHDFTLPRRGRKAVGAFRQLDRRSGKKASCQLVVAVSHVGPLGAVPLTFRLYLPAGWLRERTDDERAGLPDAVREPRSKAQLALDLLTELLVDGATERIAADPALAAGDGWEAGLKERGLACEPATDDELAAAAATGERLASHLGFGDYTGRSWDGWHRHAALSLATFGLLAAERK